MRSPTVQTRLRFLRSYDYDVAVVDWRMPGRTGMEVVSEARRLGDRTPMLMLTARDTASDRVAGLNGGADDYLVKPFDFSELLARLHALQRRPPLAHDPVLECADLRFDPSTRQVTVTGEPVVLTAIETSLVELLLRRAPSVVTRRTIGTQVWDEEADAVGSNTIDVHVGRVRAKLADSRARIETVRGTGTAWSGRDMTQARDRRRYALRVAAVATLVVMACYVVAVVVLNLLVTNHLVSAVDARLSNRLNDASRLTLSLPATAPTPNPEPAEGGTDVDDAPLFLWSVAKTGAVTPLTQGAPTLPATRWAPGPASLRVGGSTFRVDSRQLHGATLVVGQSVAGIASVQSALFVAELVFGAILAVVVFAGATVVGLRASAPSEQVRRRQAEFTADASHELRTPISVIEAEVGLALDRPRDAAAYRDVLSRVGRESARLHRIVEDLLWLARAGRRARAERVRPRLRRRRDRCGLRAALRRPGDDAPRVRRHGARRPGSLHGARDPGARRPPGRRPDRQRVQIRRRGRDRRRECPRQRTPGGATRRRLGPGDPARAAGRRLRPLPPGDALGGGDRTRSRHRRHRRAIHAGRVVHRGCSARRCEDGGFVAHGSGRPRTRRPDRPGERRRGSDDGGKSHKVLLLSCCFFM